MCEQQGRMRDADIKSYSATRGASLHEEIVTTRQDEERLRAEGFDGGHRRQRSVSRCDSFGRKGVFSSGLRFMDSFFPRW